MGLGSRLTSVLTHCPGAQLSSHIHGYEGKSTWTPKVSRLPRVQCPLGELLQVFLTQGYSVKIPLYCVKGSIGSN